MAKTIKIISVLFIALALLDLAHAGNYQQSCERISIDEKDAVLNAWCYNESGRLCQAAIDLNHCFVNRDAVLYYQCQGNAFKSCIDPILEWDVDSATAVSADCAGHPAQDANFAIISLSDYISNNDGTLTCGC